jgi:hypothetical protein
MRKIRDNPIEMGENKANQWHPSREFVALSEKSQT